MKIGIFFDATCLINGKCVISADAILKAGTPIENKRSALFSSNNPGTSQTSYNLWLTNSKNISELLRIIMHIPDNDAYTVPNKLSTLKQ